MTTPEADNGPGEGQAGDASPKPDPNLASEVFAEFSPLNPKQEAAILALLADPIISRAARTAGLSESTLRRWLNDPVFAACYRNARSSIFGQAISMSQHYASMAVQTLASIMTDKEQAGACRVAAALGVIKTAREDNVNDLRALVEQLGAMQKSAQDWTDEELMATLHENMPEILKNARRPDTAPALAEAPNSGRRAVLG
jgi:lambda repressor-like predicted transcriptional regulator